MDWIKVKTKHLLFTDFSDAEIGTLIKIQLLTAHFERRLTSEELSRFCNKKWLASAEEKLRKTGVTIEHVASKVLADVEQVVSKRKVTKKRVAKHRVTGKCNAHREEKTILDKSIEDKKEYKEKASVFDFNSIWNRYPKKVGRKAAIKHFKASVKTEEDWGKINKALDNYLEADTVKRNFIQNGSTWFNDWEGWAEMEKEMTFMERQASYVAHL